MNCKNLLTRNVTNSQKRAAFTKEYSSLVFRTSEENKAWIKKSFEEKANGLYIEFTASMLKELNDHIIKDIDLVTALINLHKQKAFDALTKSLSDQGLESVSYSDFKIGRFYVDTTPETFDSAASLIEAAFTKADQSFKDHLTAQGLVRSTDLSAQWFHLGISKNPDLASTAARKAKKENKLTRRILSLEELKELDSDRIRITKNFKSLQSNADLSFAFEKDGQLKLKVVEVFRKNKTPLAFASALFENLGTQISKRDAVRMIKLLKESDVLSPSLIVEERTSVAVDETPYGAFSLDFIGLGAKNLRSTLEGITESASVVDMIDRIRLKEQEVTEAFADHKIKIYEVVYKYFQEEREAGFISRSQNETSPLISFSGDEGIIVPYREITASDQLNLQREMFNLFGHAQLRMTFINANKNSQLETSLVSVGENIEKALKKRLLTKFSGETLSQIQFNIFIPNVETSFKAVYLYLYMPDPLTLDEKAFLKETFPQVVEDTNLTRKAEDPIFIPGVDVYAIVQSESRWRRKP
jgi:hypothetical protein